MRVTSVRLKGTLLSVFILCPPTMCEWPVESHCYSIWVMFHMEREMRGEMGMFWYLPCPTDRYLWARALQRASVNYGICALNNNACSWWLSSETLSTQSNHWPFSSHWRRDQPGTIEVSSWKPVMSILLGDCPTFWTYFPFLHAASPWQFPFLPNTQRRTPCPDCPSKCPSSPLGTCNSKPGPQSILTKKNRLSSWPRWLV